MYCTLNHEPKEMFYNLFNKIYFKVFKVGTTILSQEHKVGISFVEQHYISMGM